MEHSRINDLQSVIMLYIIQWVKTAKTPIPKKEILSKMQKKGEGYYSIDNALQALVRKKYIKRTVNSSASRGTCYIQLRSI